MLFTNISIGIFAQESLYLTVSGSNDQENKVLDSISYQKKFNEFSEIEYEIKKLRTKLHTSGFIDSRLKSLQKINDSTFQGYWKLHKKFNYITITFRSKIPSYILEKISEKYTSNSFTIRYQNAERSLQYLSDYFVKQGKTFSTLKLDKILKKKDSLFASLIIDKGNTRKIDQFVIKGYPKFPKAFLKYQLKLRKGDLLIKEEILKKSASLDNLLFVQNSKPPEVLFESDSTSVYLYLEKKVANTFDGFLGFSSDNDDSSLQINGYVDLNLINNLNLGESAQLEYKNDGNEQQRFEVSATIPYIFKSPLGVEAGLSIFRKDSSFVLTEQYADVNYLFGKQIRVKAGYESLSSDDLLTIPQSALNVSDLSSSYLRLGINYTKFKNNPLFRIKRSFNILTKTGKRKSEGIHENQFRTETLLQYHIDLNTKNSVLIRNQSALLYSKSYFLNELYRIGGINSIRGFQENTINASLYTIFNIEYNYILSSDLYLHSITDFAYFEDESNLISQNLASFGFGLGLNTTTGLFRIIFANGISEQQNFGFSNTKVHLSLSAKF